MVEGAFTVNESVLTSRASFDDGPSSGAPKSGLADDTIKALLGDQWRGQARKILSDARSTVEGSGLRLVGRPDELPERVAEGAHRSHPGRLAGGADQQPHRRSAHAAAGSPRTANSRNSPAHSPTKSKMESSFDPHALEQSLYREWEASRLFRADRQRQAVLHHDSAAERDRLAAHGPRVPAHAHGHADPLSTHERRPDALWQIGHRPRRHLDADAGRTAAERSTASAKPDIGRDAFVEKVWEWKAASGGRISEQMRRMGSSIDWSRERFTMDDGFSRAVREAFVRLYDEGLIYRGRRLVNWDPQLKTAISDLEVENTEEQGSLWHFRYPLCDGARTAEGRDYVVVATTRPETMLGDTAVAVHPDDARYSGLVGKRVRSATDRPRNPDHRRHVCRPCVRQRLREDHAGARLQRLRGRAAPRPADDQHLHGGRAPQRRRAGCLSRARSRGRDESASSPI